MRHNKSNKGFTLIELLIVIAIIGILAAVLIPNLLGARTRANDAVAQACAKSIATGQEILVIDGEEYTVVTADNYDELDGTNACKGMRITDGAADKQLSYGATVAHPSGNKDLTFVATQLGMDRVQD